jgi:xanthine dehydrogenase small subunit
VSGATDVGLWVTKRLDDPRKLLWTGRIAGFDRVTETDESVFLAAGVTHATARAALAALDPDLGEIMRRFGSEQVRASGTIGGNIANGSPIGDLAPCFIALGATLHLRRGEERRALPIEDFFIAYGRQDRRPGEFVTGVTIPTLQPGESLRAFKLSKRVDEDISTVLLALKLSISEGAIAAPRLAFGGMAGTPKRASAVEQALSGAQIGDRQAIENAIGALHHDFQPLTDMRASAAYRMAGAQGLLKRALLEMAGGAPTRIIGTRTANPAAGEARS